MSCSPKELGVQSSESPGEKKKEKKINIDQPNNLMDHRMYTVFEQHQWGIIKT